MYRLVMLAFIARYEAPLREQNLGMILDIKDELFGPVGAATTYGSPISDCVEELKRRDRQP